MAKLGLEKRREGTVICFEERRPKMEKKKDGKKVREGGCLGGGTRWLFLGSVSLISFDTFLNFLNYLIL